MPPGCGIYRSASAAAEPWTRRAPITAAPPTCASKAEAQVYASENRLTNPERAMPTPTPNPSEVRVEVAPSLVASMHHAVRQTAAPVSMCWRSKMLSLLQVEDQL